MPKRVSVVLLLLVILLIPGSGFGLEAMEEGDLVEPRKAWELVLEKHHQDGGLEYAALQLDRQDLDIFLGSLEDTESSALEVENQIAFWINAYNAVVIFHVLERCPELDSVKDVDGFFDELRYPIAGQHLTLDEIEGNERALGDARVHVAVVCASTSCPDLRSEPYRGEELDAQLEDSIR